MKKNPNTMRCLVYACTVCALSAALAFTGTTLAKYVTSNQNQGLVAARDFRFESNYLESTDVTYSVYGDEVTITLSNHDGLTKTEDPLSYQLEIVSGSSTLDSTSGTIASGNMQTNAHVLKGSGSVTVKATSTSPYSKTLQATFVFQPQNGYYTVTDHERYVQVDVYTGDAQAGLIVTGRDHLTADVTNENFTSDGNIDALDADSHYTFVYFKNSSNSYQPVSNGQLDGIIELS